MARMAMTEVRTSPNLFRRWSPLASIGLAVSMVIVTLGLVGTTPSASAASSTATWHQLSPTNSPSARNGASMAYDPATGQLVLFGGVTTNSYLNDTWTWNGSNWTQFAPATSPPARAYATMAYDSGTGQLVLFGGYNGGNLGDTWTWNGLTWTQLNPATSPSGRYEASMAYDTCHAATGALRWLQTAATSATPGPGTAPPGPSSTRPPAHRPATAPRWPTTPPPASWCSSAATATAVTSTTPGPGTAPTGPSSTRPPAHRPAPAPRWPTTRAPASWCSSAGYNGTIQQLPRRHLDLERHHLDPAQPGHQPIGPPPRLDGL